MFENARRGRQARNFTTNVPKIIDLKSSSQQIFFENWRWVPLTRVNISIGVHTTPGSLSCWYEKVSDSGILWTLAKMSRITPTLSASTCASNVSICLSLSVTSTCKRWEKKETNCDCRLLLGQDVMEGNRDVKMRRRRRRRRRRRQRELYFRKRNSFIIGLHVQQTFLYISLLSLCD